MYITNKKGFTLIETLVALSVGVIISGVVAMVMVNGFANVRRAKQTERLHANTVKVTDTLTYLIKDSDDLELVDSSTLNIHSPDGTLRTVTLDSGSVTLDGAPITDTGIDVISLNFNQIDGSIHIAINMESSSSDKTLSTTTTVAKRNKL